MARSPTGGAITRSTDANPLRSRRPTERDGPSSCGEAAAGTAPARHHPGADGVLHLEARLRQEHSRRLLDLVRGVSQYGAALRHSVIHAGCVLSSHRRGHP